MSPMALIPSLVGIVVAIFLGLVTIYFLFIIAMTERFEHHRPRTLQTRSGEDDGESLPVS